MRIPTLAWPVLVLTLAAVVTAQAEPRKINIAHRGASAYVPEHTLAAYTLAIEQGADFVEPDLVVTKDGVLVCLHDITLERTTDVEERFPDRYRDDAFGMTGRHWFVLDFTLEEVKQLDAGAWFDPKFAGARVPTFDEMVALVRGKAGLYPELKHPEVYRELGVDMEGLVAASLRKHGLIGDTTTPVVLQSFEEQSLRNLAKLVPEVPRAFLISAPAMIDRWLTPDGLREMKGFVTGVAPHKAIVLARPELVKQAHDLGLTVTLWTFRSSDTGTFPSVAAEMSHYLYTLGVDEVFTDNPDQFPRAPVDPK